MNDNFYYGPGKVFGIMGINDDISFKEDDKYIDSYSDEKEGENPINDDNPGKSSLSDENEEGSFLNRSEDSFSDMKDVSDTEIPNNHKNLKSTIKPLKIVENQKSLSAINVQLAEETIIMIRDFFENKYSIPEILAAIHINAGNVKNAIRSLDENGAPSNPEEILVSTKTKTALEDEWKYFVVSSK